MINRDDWLRALREASNAPEPPSDAISLKELSELFGMGLAATQRKVDRLLAAGTAQATTKQIRMKNGGLRSVTAYRLVTTTDTEVSQHAIEA